MDQTITRAAGAAPRVVGEFQGYVDGVDGTQPSVRWLDRKNMPEVGSKLCALPPAAAIPRTWSLLLTSKNRGVVSAAGSQFDTVPENYERVQVMEIVEAGAAPAPGTDLAGLVRFDFVDIDGDSERFVEVAAGGYFLAHEVEARIGAPVAAQAGQVAPTDLHDAIMRLRETSPYDPVRHSTEHVAYKCGHRDARHAAAELVAGVAAGQVAVLAMTDAEIVSVWQGMPGGAEGWLKQFGYLQFARAVLAAAPASPAVAQQASAQAKPMPATGHDWQAIGPLPVVRDENGWWSHPAIPNFDEDVDSYLAWVKAVGLEMKYKALESDPDHPLYDAWFEDGECNASSWEPEQPAGDGWFTFSIHDSEDGPIWAWARRVGAQASTSGERQEGGAA